MEKPCCGSNTKFSNMINTDQLIKVAVPSPKIVPVGITPSVLVDGKVANQIQGKGEGIFSSVLNTAAMLYSTIKPPAGTVGSVPAPGLTAGNLYGTGNFKTTFDNASSSSSNGGFLGISPDTWKYILGGFIVAKLLKLF